MDISDKINKTYSNIQAALDELSSEWNNSAHRRPKNQRAECLLENALGLLDEIKEEPWPLTSEDYIDG